MTNFQSVSFHLRMLAAVIGGVFLLSVGLPGQTFFGSIVGTITDASSASVEGAEVTVTNIGTSERHAATTAGDGTYRFVNLIPGNYRVQVERTGFKSYTRGPIPVEVEAAVRIDVAMQVGDVSQSVEVAATAPLIQTENASISQVVQGRAVEELPLNGRNVLNLVTLVPGVVPQGGSMASLTGQNVFSAGNYQLGGGTANQSDTLFDGVPSTVSYGHALALVPSQDVVAEFRVQTSNLTAEFGRYSGGVINTASKSGSNSFHGSTYEYLRNTRLNANTFFANRNNAGKAAFHQNQFGVTAGGPIKKDKTFFFAGYEGFRQRYGKSYLYSEPTPQELTGDFSALRSSTGPTIIYDPLTQCGQYNNAACGSGTVQRDPFPGNMIPASRFNPVALNYIKIGYWAKPNLPGAPGTFLNNFAINATAGGDNNQWNGRIDHTLSEKQRLFARFTRWDSTNVPVKVFGNPLFLAGDPVSPEQFVTTQAVLGDTVTFSPNLVGDFRISYQRWFYNRVPGDLGIDIPKTYGLPAYYSQIPAIDGFSPVTISPQMAISGYNQAGTGVISARENNYTITPNLTWIRGRHTLKFGADFRRLDDNYFQANQPAGTFSFDNIITSQNALSSGATGNAVASFLLGYPASGTNQTAPFTAGSMRYQGYFGNDSFQIGTKLTVNLGLRWEIPGVWTERFDRQALFNPTEVNPVLSGINVLGHPVLGAFDLVNSATHPQRGIYRETYGLFAPRVGFAYRMTDKTVIRAGAGVFFIPADVQFTIGPYGNAADYYNNVMVATTNSGVTPFNTLSNPYPNGLNAAPGRNPAYQQLFLGNNPRAPLGAEAYGYTEQWNFTVQHQFGPGIALEAGYVGLRGVHLPQGSYNLNQLPDQYLSLGSQLLQQVPNPLAPFVSNGLLSQPTVQLHQLLQPFPQYAGSSQVAASLSNPGAFFGNSSYHSLQVKAEKRFNSGGTVLASYTFSKIISNVETVTTWLDSATGTGGVQDYNNMKGEFALSSFDSRRRLVLSYVYDLPFGKGHKFLSGLHGFADRVVTGWGINGVTTFQPGFPLALTASPNNFIFGGGLRPNVTTGCNKEVSGSAQSKYASGWFNTSCFTFPAQYTYGTQSRTDPELRGPGIANYDLAIYKKTAITERFNLEFRAEAFNLFNRVQFGTPNTTFSTAATTTFGQITSQLNQPRLIQLAMRLRF
jgi:hypothetical protein